MPKRKASEDDITVRRRVFDKICELPGLYADELAKVTKLKHEAIQSILEDFEDDCVVEIRLEAGKKQYFPLASMGLEDKKILSLLRKDLHRKVICLVLDSPHLTMEEIEERLERPMAEISLVIEEFFKVGTISLARDTHKGNKTTFQVFEPEKIRKLLEAKERSLLQLFD